MLLELSSDFDLNFPSAVISDKAQLSGILPDLYEFTLAFWMKTSDISNSGTPISYAVRGLDGEEDMDNALTLQDYNNFVLSVNEKIAFTYVAANRYINHVKPFRLNSVIFKTVRYSKMYKTL